MLLATAYQCYYLWRVFPLAFNADKAYPKPDTLPPVSVIICCKNEAEQLKKHEAWIKEQQYPHWELIFVDDYSTDESPEILKGLASQYAQIRWLRPPAPTRPGKKDALTYGISRTRHDILLLTDADCQPASSRWIELMTAPLTADEKLEVVLGVSPYRATMTAVNGFQRFETLYTAFQYLGLARKGCPYMGVGRNLAYRKSFFQRAGGLTSHAHLPGGDDDLLISQHARPAATATVTEPAAWTISEPAVSWREYWRQKMRHVGVGGHYPIGPKLLIGGLALSHLLHYGLILLLLLLGKYQVPVLGCLMLRWGLVLWVYNWRSSRMIQYQGIQKLSPIWYDFGLCLYYALTAVALLRPAAFGFSPGKD